LVVLEKMSDKFLYGRAIGVRTVPGEQKYIISKRQT